METVWIVLTQLVLLHTVTVNGSTANLALRKPTSASSMQSGYIASTAVDGNTVANSGSTSKIILTRTGQFSAWWMVDLQREVQDATVRIYFRTDYTARRNGVTLYTSTTPISGRSGQWCHTVRGEAHGRNINSTYSVTCLGRWRYLLLYTDTRKDGLAGPVLDFGEVEILACPRGRFGTNCTEKCGQCVDVCNNVDGSCPRGKTMNQTGSIALVAGGAAAALLIIGIIVVTVVVCRRKRKIAKHKDKEERFKSQDKKCNIAMDLLNQAETGKAEPSGKSKQSTKMRLKSKKVKGPKSVNHKHKGQTSVLTSEGPSTPPPSSRDDGDDQSEEDDEHEAPSSKTYYNFDEDAIREVAVDDLAATVQKIQRREGGFEAEYNRLPTGFTAPYDDSQKEENKAKNKFRGYYPYDHNRVRLSLLPDVPGSDYINASIMLNYSETKTYVAAQAPKKITLGDFWRMIWEEGCSRIVMLTGLVEEMKVKCYQYWPENDLLTTDHFRVALVETQIRANYTVRIMKVEKVQFEECRRVVQYHYTTWPDHGVPDTLALVKFIWMMRRTHTRTDGPLLVHCSAGIGRTGTYIAVDSLLDQAREEGKVDVQGYVSIMRGQRKNMIQTAHQYECVFNCLVEMTKYGNTSLSVDDFTTLYTNSGLDAQVDSDSKTFRELAQLMLSGQTSGAAVKNQMWVDGNKDFIIKTAPSLRSVTGHLLCKSPHPGQEKLLWKLVEENNVNNVIVLDKTHMKTELTGKKGATKKVGTFKITRKQETNPTANLKLSTLLLQEPMHENKQKVQLLEFNESVSTEQLSSSLLELPTLKLMISELSPRVLVHSSTDRKTGVMFCILGNLMSEIQEDETVDVLHQVRSFIRSFPDIKLTQDDVKQLFDFARRCVKLTASTDANM